MGAADISPLRSIPSIDRLLNELGETDLPRPLVAAVARRELDQIRASIRQSDGANGASHAPAALDRVRAAVQSLKRGRIQPVINGTGIIIHTNLGRSPMGQGVIDAIAAAAGEYSNLEYDLDAGGRGGRGGYVEQALAILCGAAAATVVNNCAAALVLILRHYCAAAPKNEVIISRGELVQIGGGFRIPDILAASGATLREVGTTNITTIDDYRSALSDRSAMILRVHPSNFRLSGFTHRAASPQLSALAREADIPFVEDLGSGATFDTTPIVGEHEATPAEVLADGADLVCFSGDKLLGGPQAGIIAGDAGRVAKIKKEPFFRALRCDKLILSALQATVDLLLRGEADEIPIRLMMETSCARLTQRAAAISDALQRIGIDIRIGAGESRIGGGALPERGMPSITLDLRPREGTLDALAERLRAAEPPVVGYIADDSVKLDLRTIFPRYDQQLVAAIASAMAAGRA